MPRLPTEEPIRGRETKTFWDGIDEGKLLLPRCDACDHVIWYPRLFCPSCHTSDVSWFEASGRGVIYSFTVARQAYGPWKAAVPYVIAYVELEEGPRVLTNIVDGDPDRVAVGDAVRLVIDRSPEGAGVYRFAPV